MHNTVNQTTCIFEKDIVSAKGLEATLFQGEKNGIPCLIIYRGKTLTRKNRIRNRFSLGSLKWNNRELTGQSQIRLGREKAQEKRAIVYRIGVTKEQSRAADKRAERKFYEETLNVDKSLPEAAVSSPVDSASNWRRRS